MSLINDALKRASQAQKQAPPSPRVAAPLQPVDSLRPRPASAILVPFVLVILLSVAGWFLWSWWQSRLNTTPNSVTVNPPPPPRPPSVVAQQNIPPAPPPNPNVGNQNPAAILTNHPVTRVIPTPPQTNPVAVAVSLPMPDPSTNLPTPPPVEIKTNPPAVVIAPVPPPPPKPEFPSVTLQGIFFDPSRPTALINGKVVAVGDEIGEIKVEAIDARSVKLQFNGMTKVLKLP